MHTHVCTCTYMYCTCAKLIKLMNNINNCYAYNVIHASYSSCRKSTISYMYMCVHTYVHSMHVCTYTYKKIHVHEIESVSNRINVLACISRHWTDLGLLGLHDGQQLLGNDRQHLDVDTVELIEAAPRP